MINDIIGNKTLIPILKRILDLGAVRHRVIAQNIANASTNGYRKKSVDFEERL
ncbi:MAG: flagellar biosynthesis protein FlgB, partial [Candidatus Marinimicrobia bacterium]|nr:flagellar biosynthesis protein FlgB [Candidatus Neomarinimicrobiota bacterium]